MTDSRNEGLAREESFCPSDDRFLDFFLENKAGPEEEALLDHIGKCPDCRAKFGLLRDLEPVLQKQSRRLRPLARASRRELRGHFDRPGKAGRTRPHYSLAAAGSAAAFLLAAAILIGLPPVGNDAPERARPNSIVAALPAGRVSEAPRLFAWESFPGGVYYRFELIDERLRLISVLTTHETWVLIPESWQNEFLPGRTFIWTVEAFNDDEIKIGEIRRTFDMR